MTAQINTADVLSITFEQIPADAEMTAYEVHSVVNAIHEVLDRPAITPQQMYGKIKTFLKVESMAGEKLNKQQITEFVTQYINGGVKTSSAKLADQIKIALAKKAESKSSTPTKAAAEITK